MSKFNIRTIQAFEKQAKRLKKKYPSIALDIANLAQLLENDPTIGIGCYKIRMAIASKKQGKSGGARVITYVKILDEVISFLAFTTRLKRAILNPAN